MKEIPGCGAWRMLLAMPEDITLSDQKCKDVDFAIVLSYDYSSFSVGDGYRQC